LITINNHVPEIGTQMLNSTLHSDKGCLQDIEAINFTYACKADSDAGLVMNECREFIASGFGQEFRIGDAFYIKIFRQNNCCRKHRSSETAPTNLINPNQGLWMEGFPKERLIKPSQMILHRVTTISYEVCYVVANCNYPEHAIGFAIFTPLASPYLRHWLRHIYAIGFAK
jgi:hypothetical protein